MQIGVSERSGYGLADARTGARWMIERTRAARDAGLDSLFLGEHHATGGTYYQNVPMLGRLLAEWGDRPAGALFLLPLWHPVTLAEQVGTLASLTRGRFILQCALGGGDEQFGGMGVPLRGRVARFESTLAVLRRLLAGEQVTTDEPLPLRSARSGPLPPEPVDVWIGGSAPAAIDRAARLGDGWIAAPGVTPAQAAAQLEQYRSSCAAHRSTSSRQRRCCFSRRSSVAAPRVSFGLRAKSFPMFFIGLSRPTTTPTRTYSSSAEEIAR